MRVLLLILERVERKWRLSCVRKRSFSLSKFRKCYTFIVFSTCFHIDSSIIVRVLLLVLDRKEPKWCLNFVRKFPFISSSNPRTSQHSLVFSAIFTCSSSIIASVLRLVLERVERKRCLKFVRKRPCSLLKIRTCYTFCVCFTRFHTDSSIIVRILLLVPNRKERKRCEIFVRKLPPSSSKFRTCHTLVCFRLLTQTYSSVIVRVSLLILERKERKWCLTFVRKVPLYLSKFHTFYTLLVCFRPFPHIVPPVSCVCWILLLR